MDTALFGSDIYRDEAAMAERVVTYAVRTYGDRVSHDLLERWAREAVASVWGEGPSVTKYVPMLALRLVKEHVREHAGKHAASQRASESLEPWTSAGRTRQTLLDQLPRYGGRPSRRASSSVAHSAIRDVTKPQHQRGHERTG
jgi:hypothetical protein